MKKSYILCKIFYKIVQSQLSIYDKFKRQHKIILHYNYLDIKLKLYSNCYLIFNILFRILFLFISLMLGLAFTKEDQLLE